MTTFVLRAPSRFFLLIFLALAPALAQQTPAAQQATPASPAQAATSTAPTLKATAQLVVVDVVVTDRNQRPVHGLKASDFTLSESGVPQAIKHFEEHTALTLADATKLEPMPALPPGVFTNYTPAPPNGAINLLLLDALNTPMKNQAYVRQQLLAYLRSVPPGTRIAIFGLTSRLTVLQGFTSDPEVLKGIMTKGLAKASVLLDDPAGGAGIQNSVADDLEDNGADATTVANLREFDARQQTFQLELRTKYTLDAMNQIAHYLSGIPGRKNLIWFSGSFPLNVLPDTTGNLLDPFAAMSSSEDEFRTTVGLLARSQVAVYPIDARGLMTSPVFDASTSRNYGGAKGVARMSQDQDKFLNDTFQEHGTMKDMAQATGGRAFVDTNDLTKAVATAIDEGSNFYTLSYTPTNSEHDGKLHKIKIQAARQGLTLAYRQGYYADDPDAAKPRSAIADSAVTKAAGPTSADTWQMAMTRGAPTPSEILVKVAVYPVGAPSQTEDKAAPRNQPTSKAKGPYRRYNVNYAINPSDITFQRGPDGKIHADFEAVVFVFDPDGNVVNSIDDTIRLASSLEELQKAFAAGIHYGLEVSAPAKGEYFLRIAIHDLNRDHYGAVEVAVSSVKNLTMPIAPPQAK
jgi:VWFA-related protein